MAVTPRIMDFTNVKDAGNFQPRQVPVGDYRATITKVEDHASKSGTAVDNWVFTIVLKSRARNTYPYYCGFKEDQMWKVRGLFMAAGIAVPKKRVKVDPSKLIGKEIGVAMDDDEYEGKMKSTVVTTFPVSDLAEDYPGASSGGSKSSSKGSNDDDVEDADDDTTDADAEDLDLDEI